MKRVECPRRMQRWPRIAALSILLAGAGGPVYASLDQSTPRRTSQPVEELQYAGKSYDSTVRPPVRGSSAEIHGGSSADRYGGSSADKRGVAGRTDSRLVRPRDKNEDRADRRKAREKEQDEEDEQEAK